MPGNRDELSIEDERDRGAADPVLSHGLPPCGEAPAPPLDTRQRILEAAKEEFASVGLAGARVAEIARRAECNKQLIYHYFGDKSGLYAAAITDVLGTRPPLEVGSRADFEELLLRGFEAGPARRRFLRMLMWEALAEEEELVGEQHRREISEKIVAHVSRLQGARLVDPGLPPRFVLMAIFALITLPWLLPQFAKLVTGHRPHEPAFVEGYGSVLRALARRLGPET